MIKIGLTGGYGTGKTTVTRMFKELGAPVIDADDIVHDLLASDKEIISGVVDYFGKEAISPGGGIDRKKIAEIVFSDEKALKTLTEILYPSVKRKITEWFNGIRQEKKYRAAIAEVSLLIEDGDLGMYDRIMLVIADSKVQKERCLSKGISDFDFERRLKNQMPLEEKKKYADYIIDNSGSLEKTKQQILKIWNEINN